MSKYERGILSPILEERRKKRFLSAKKKLLFGDKYGNKDKGEI